MFEHDLLLQRDQRRIVEPNDLRGEAERDDFGAHRVRALTPPPIPCLPHVPTMGARTDLFLTDLRMPSFRRVAGAGVGQIQIATDSRCLSLSAVCTLLQPQDPPQNTLPRPSTGWS